MADFCQQCSLAIFDEDSRDLANLTASNIGTIIVLCEGCGMVQVDVNGKCVDDGCPIHGKRLRTTGK